jgi:hypothetical protein
MTKENETFVVKPSEYTSELHKTAVEYAGRGFKVFPLAPLTKIPTKASKGSLDATDDIDVINRWWTTNPEYNIGIATGPKSGITVVDFDTEDAWNTAQSKGLPNGPLVKTFRGYHLYCQNRGVSSTNGRNKRPGIDIKGNVGYVVAPPSVRKDKDCPEPFTYSWVEGKGT